MRKRSQAREFALQILYQIDITRSDPKECLNNFWQSRADQEKSVGEDIKEFTVVLVLGVMENLKALDDEISLLASNWKIKRMAVIDRNILRMASFELIYCQDIPPKVSINEAIDLAKKYSGDKAGKFVNGILDNLKTEKNK